MQSILFLYLKAFSVTGGIEKVNRTLLRALHDFEAEGLARVRAASPYDTAPDERYFPALPPLPPPKGGSAGKLPPPWGEPARMTRSDGGRGSRFLGFAGNRWRFMLDVATANYRADTLLVGHINLAPAALLLRRRYPRLRLVVIAHGIEVWSPLAGLKRQLLHRADRIVAVSEFTRQKLIELQGVAPERVVVLPNCLDPFFEPPTDFSKPAYLLERYGLRPDQPVALTVSRLNTNEGYKGYDKVLLALARLRRERPDLVYLLAGRADATERARLEGLVAELELGDRVRLPGFVPDHELTDHYRLADVFVMPSKKEGFGLVFIEAMACGTPAIGGNCDGSVEALGHGRLGTLVDPDNVAAIAGSMRAVLGAPPRPAALQQGVLAENGFARYRMRLQAALRVEGNYHRVTQS